MKKLLFVLMFLVFPVHAQEIEGWPETIEEEIHLLFTKECIGELARLYSRFSGRTQEDEFDFLYSKLRGDYRGFEGVILEEVEGEDVKKRSGFYIEWAEKCKKDVLELVKDGLLEVSEVLKEEDVKGDYLYIPVEGGLPGTASFDEEVSLEEEIHQTFAMSCIADVARFYSLFSGRGFLEEFDYRYDKNKVVFIEMEQELLKYFQKIRADGSDSKFARSSVYLDWKSECQDHLRKEFIARIEDHVERLEIEGYLR